MSVAYAYTLHIEQEKNGHLSVTPLCYASSWSYFSPFLARALSLFCRSLVLGRAPYLSVEQKEELTLTTDQSKRQKAPSKAHGLHVHLSICPSVLFLTPPTRLLLRMHHLSACTLAALAPPCLPPLDPLLLCHLLAPPLLSLSPVAFPLLLLLLLLLPQFDT